MGARRLSPARNTRNRRYFHRSVGVASHARRQAEEALRFQAQLLAAVDQAIIAFDFDGRLIYWNPAAERIFGHEASSGCEAEPFAPEELRREISAVQVDAGRPFAGELLCRRAEGSQITIHATASLYHDAAGRPAGIIAAISDVSAYKAVEAALRESEARYRHLVEMQTELVCRYDPASCRLTFVNEAYCRAYGRSREELIGASFLDLIAPESRAEVAARAAAFTPAEPLRFNEHCIVGSDGSLRWHRWSDRAIFDEAGRLVDVICVGSDITERVRAEEELRRLNDDLERRVAARTAELSTANGRLAELNRELASSQELLRTLLDSLADAIALVSPQGLVRIANQALGALLDTEPDALIGRPWAELDLPGLAQIRAAAAGRDCAERVQVARPGGRTVVFDVQAISLGDADEETGGIVLRLSDVTEQVQLEALAIANEGLAANGRLAAIVAHEISTPLQAIENLLYLAGDRPGYDGCYLPLVRDEIRRVSTILRRLLTLSQPDPGPAGPLDCSLVIDRVLVLTGTSLARRGIAVSRELPARMPLVAGSADQLTQVLLNLVVNAIDAMPAGGRLAIAAEARADCLLVSVADSGPGVPPELQERIFEPFFTTKAGGSGLGLAVGRRIMGQHGGRLDVESAPGQGARFVLSLPLAGGTEFG